MNQPQPRPADPRSPASAVGDADADRRSATVDAVDAVVAVLGGADAVADLFGCTRKAINAWRAANRFPWHAYPAIQAALRDRGVAASDALWPPRRRRPARRRRGPPVDVDPKSLL